MCTLFMCWEGGGGDEQSSGSKLIFPEIVVKIFGL